MTKKKYLKKPAANPAKPASPKASKPDDGIDHSLLSDLFAGAQEEADHPSSEREFAGPSFDYEEEPSSSQDAPSEALNPNLDRVPVESVTPEVMEAYDGDEADEAELVGGTSANILDAADRVVDRGQKLKLDGLTVEMRIENGDVVKAPHPNPSPTMEEDPSSNLAAHADTDATLRLHAAEALRKHPNFRGRLLNIEKLKCWPEVRKALDLGYRFSYIARMIHAHGEWKDMRPDEISLVLNNWRTMERRRAFPGSDKAKWRLSDAEPFPVAPDHVSPRDLNSMLVAQTHDMLMSLMNDVKRSDISKNLGVVREIREYFKVAGALAMQSAELEERERKALLSSAPPKASGDVADIIQAQREHYQKVYGNAGNVIMDPVARRRVLTIWEKIQGYMSPAVKEALEANKKEFAKIEKAAQARRERMADHERRMARDAAGEVEGEEELLDDTQPENAEPEG